MRRRWWILFCIGVIGGFFFAWYQAPPHIFDRVLSMCLSQYEARKDRLGCIQRGIEEQVVRDGIGGSMMGLEKSLTNTSQKTDVFHCHDIAHMIGKIGATHTTDVGSVIDQCTSLCGDGCYHGVVEGYLSQGNGIETALTSLCEGKSTACFHGLGHGVASLAPDIQKSLALCDFVKDPIGKKQCGYGVLMELYESTTSDHATLSIPSDILGFCRSLPSVYVSVCLSKAGIHEYKRTNNLAAVGRICARISNSSECMNLFGVLMYWQYQDKTGDIVDACQKTGQEESCLLGAIEESVSIDPKATRAMEICASASDAFARPCFFALQKKIHAVYAGKEADPVAVDLMSMFGQKLFGRLREGGITLCDESMEWSCFFGFIKGHARDASFFSGVTDACHSLSDTPLQLSTCFAGIGRALVFLQGKGLTHLVKALETCDMFSDIGRKTCYNGVIRQYNKDRRVVTGDPFVPCSSLSLPYQSYCFSWQPQVWNAELKADISTMGSWCRTVADDASRKECFGGIGRVIVGSPNYTARTVEGGCSRVPTDEGIAFCTIEAMRQMFVDGQREPLLICDTIEGDLRQTCKEAGKQFACHVLQKCE